MEQEHVNSVVNAMSSLFREPFFEGGRAKGTLHIQFRFFFGKKNLRWGVEVGVVPPFGPFKGLLVHLK